MTFYHGHVNMMDMLQLSNDELRRVIRSSSCSSRALEDLRKHWREEISKGLVYEVIEAPRELSCDNKDGMGMCAGHKIDSKKEG